MRIRQLSTRFPIDHGKSRKPHDRRDPECNSLGDDRVDRPGDASARHYHRDARGELRTGLPKGCKRRNAIYPARTPLGYPLAEKFEARTGQVRAELTGGRNPLGRLLAGIRLASGR
jgi:hypothetical protein